jgi:hypothetical protein
MVRCQWDRVHFLSSLTLGSRPVRPPTPLGLAALKSVKSHFFAIEAAPTIAARVRALMRQLGLDQARRPTGGLSPLALLEQAERHLEMPGTKDDASSILLPLREAIDAALDELEHRGSRGGAIAQAQGEKRYRKIVGIGTTCGNASVPQPAARFFDQRGKDGVAAYNHLSQTKKAKVARDEVRRLFIEGVSFLEAFLGGLDPAKLR